MYGKRFIAALMFLTVAEVEVNAYSHYGGYGGYGGYGDYDEEDGFEAAGEEYIPSPDYYLDTDMAVEVPIPDMDLDITHAYFCLEMVDDYSAVWDWAD